MVVELAATRIMLLMLVVVFHTKESSSSAIIAKPGCQDTCGNVSIPYPFGIGPDCYAYVVYNITCDNSSTPPRPIIHFIGLELLNVISVSEATFRVLSPIVTSNCPNRPDRLAATLHRTPFQFSEKHTRFTAMGCNIHALMYSREHTVIGDCYSYCDLTRNTGCNGTNCCQIRFGLTQQMNATLESIDSGNKNNQTCAYAFMVDQEWFNNLTDPNTVKGLENVPVVVEWRTYGVCNTFGIDQVGSGSPLCGANAQCYNQTPGYVRQSFRCGCDHGYAGNPYLPNGCQDIDECANPKDNNCGQMLCMNTPGNYSCYCPSGYIAGGSICYKMSIKNRTIVIGICSGIGGLLLLVGMWYLWKILKRRKKNKLKQKFFKRNGGLLLQQQLSSGEGDVQKTKIFTSKELEKATDYYNKNRILGQGGQGTVFKGMLKDGRIVAVKKSKIMDKSQLDQFINEVVILSQINHRNIVKIFGCCLEIEVPLLVYEFIPNGTLFQYIHEENEEFPLSWNKRVQIAAEVAGALSYLHSAASIPIYHRDIKSSNILLDEKYRAKVADFGTSRSLAIDQTHLTTRVIGTYGYLDPEYFQSSQFTEKSDVYSFGVVLVELLTGQKPISSTLSEEGRSLATHFTLMMEENKLYDIVIASLLKEGGKHEIMVIANLAKRCLNLNGRNRPTMKEVVMELEGVRVLQGASTTRNNYEEVEYEGAELNGPWDVTSTPTGSYIETGGSSSIDSQPLFLNYDTL